MKTRWLTEGELAALPCLHRSRDHTLALQTESAWGTPVVYKAPLIDPVPPEQSERIGNEFRLTSGRQPPGIRRALAQLNINGKAVLALEYVEGETLGELLGHQSLPLPEILRLGIKIATVLETTHRQGLVHRNLAKSHILVSPDRTRVVLISFGSASRITGKGMPAKADNYEGAVLAYISPEQSGRTDRLVDRRTDLYSFGVLLYEMFTGTLPFESDNPGKLIHCHLALKPLSPSSVVTEIPEAVSDIILRLLAKNPDERYQSAYGVRKDLEKCLALLLQGEHNPEFQLAEADYSTTIQPPGKLYGRDEALRELIDAVERAQKGDGGAVLISGQAGVGKSFLVEKFRHFISLEQVTFCKGEYDAARRFLPYTGLMQAYREVIDMILSGNATELTQRKSQLLEAISGSDSLLVDMLPQLKLIIGPQPATPNISSKDSQHLSHHLLKRFTFALATKEHPLVLFLDNLQWADPATLRLLPLLLSDIGKHPIVMIGAYRQDELGANHPLVNLVDGIALQKIVLENLSRDEMCKLIGDSLSLDSEQAQSLTYRIVKKTGGNPTSTLQFLVSLQENGQLWFDTTKNQWSWDDDAIDQLEIVASIADTVSAKLSELPPEIQQLLSIAACIGYRFNLETLSNIVDAPTSHISGQLDQAVDAGIIRLVEQATPFAEPANKENIFAFSHDRVHQAAYTQLSRKERREIHLQIGKKLIAQTPHHYAEHKVFEITDQLNEGFQYLTQEEERMQLVALNLMAGRRARRAAAYQAAIRYLSMGIGLLPDDRWTRSRQLALNLYIESVEAEYLSTNFERAALLSKEALVHAGDSSERLRLYELQIQLFTALEQDVDALQSGLNALTELDLPLETTAYEDNTYPTGQIIDAEADENNSIERLAHLPEMTDTRLLACMRILMQMTIPAQRTDMQLLDTIISRMMMLTAMHGKSAISAIAYAWHAARCCGEIERIETGYRFGLLALEITRQFASDELEPRVVFLFNAYTRHWKEHLRESLLPLEQAFNHSVDADDLVFIHQSAILHCSHLFFTGTALDALSSRQADYLQAIERSQLLSHARTMRIWRQIVANLRGECLDPCQLSGVIFDDTRLPSDWMDTSDSYFVFTLLSCRMILRYLFDDYIRAAKDGRLAEKYADSAHGHILQANYSFYYALTLIAQQSTSSVSESSGYIQAAAPHIDLLKRWTRAAPMNFAHKLALVQAEQACVTGASGRAMEYFSKSIRLARENGYLQDEALAFEREALFYEGLGRNDFAQSSRHKAVNAYKSWGATRKASELEHQFRRQQGPAGAPLDTAAIVKASHMLSQEIHLEQLLDKLMRIVIEHAGAEKGVWIQNSSSGLVIQAQSRIGQNHVKTMQGVPAVTSGEVAPTVVNYVARTQGQVVLGNAKLNLTFGTDAYIVEHHVRSLLCLPIVYQGKLSGLLYLENNLASDVFNEDRLELLKALASQAAISIENAALYDEQESNLSALRESEQKFRAIFDQTFQFIGVLDTQGILLQANKTALEFAEIDEAEVLGKPFWDTPWWTHSPNLQQRLRIAVSQAAKGKLVRFEATHNAPDGKIRYVDFSLKPVTDADGKVTQLIPEGREITERKQAEMALQRLNREYRAISQCNEVLVRAVDEQELLDDICRIVCEEAGYRFAWVGYPQNDDRKTIRLAAKAGIEEDMLQRSRISWAKTEYDFDPCASVIRSGDIVRFEDLSQVSLAPPWQTICHILGFRSSIALPLTNTDNRVFGVLNIFSGESRAFSEEEQRLLKELADDLAYGIISLRTRAEHLLAEEQIRIAATAFEAQEGIAITDANERILRVNRAFTEITGFTSKEIVGKTPRLLKSKHHNKAYYQAMWDAIGRDGAWQGEILNRRKNGDVYPASLNITAVKNAQGKVTHYVSTITDITERKASEKKIKHLAFYDLLTDLPNRRLLQDRLHQATISCSRNRRMGGLLFIDLDNFKILNDTCGHDIGDRLLIEVARRLTTCVREGDTIARLGGDEFIVMLEDLNTEREVAAGQVKNVAEKIQSTLNQPYTIVGRVHHSSPSIGATLFSDSKNSVDELLKQADIAMYQAKTAGRNTLRFFDPNMQATLAKRATTEAALRLSIQDGAFALHYQPQVDRRHGIIGAEALLRWQHPDRGVTPPSEFIPLAEESGLILRIGQWVLDNACAQLAEWSSALESGDFYLAVNVSALQFRQTEFVNQVRDALAKAGAPATRLKLELTESLVLDNVKDSINKMRALKEIGVGFAMDDFGTGYSSLSYLTQLPLDQLKIDQSFIGNLPQSQNDAVVVQTIINLAKSLHLAVIAEGVETEAQRVFLQQHGCPVIQGFLISKPLEAQAMNKLLQRY
jgi:diguanylate cyclase (GGDEF)-like protein/PAS domain S-box-containing protein